MSKLDTNHVVNLDLVKDRVNSIIKFGLADVETSDFFVGLYNNGSRVFDKDYIVTLYIVKPNGTFRNIKLEPKEGLKKYYCNLPDTLKNIAGEYVCQVMVFDNLTGEKKISKSKFKYSVSVDLASEMAGIIDEEEQESILTNILNRLLTLENPVEPYATQKHVDECVSTLTEEIDTIKVKDVEQDGKLVDIESKDNEQDGRLTTIETKDVEQDGRLINIESKNTEQDNRLTSIEAKDVEQDGRLNLLENQVDGIDEKIADTIEPSLDNYGNRLDALETKDIEHELRMTNIESKNIEQDNRLTSIEGINTTQNNRLDTLEAKDIVHESRMTDIETKNTEQDSRLDIAENRLANIGDDITNTMQPIIDEHTSRLDAIEAIDVAQNSRLDAIEVKNQQQDDRLLDIEKVNNRQDIDIKCLYGTSQTIDVTKEGNSIYLQNSNNGFAVVDEIKGNTLVNCNKEPDKELILNGNINTSGDNTVTLTEGVDGGLVDVALEGNTLVNVSKTKDSTAITKVYTVENSGNHVALQGDIDGSCRPVITGNTLVNLMTAYKTESLLEYFYPSNSDNVANVSMLKPNTEYTLIYTAKYQQPGDGGCLVIHLTASSDDGIATSQDLTTSYSQYIYKFTTPSNVEHFVLRVTGSYFYIKECMLLEGDYTDKIIPDYFTGLQSTFEDNLVTQEMVDSGEEVTDNLGKYRVDYKVTGKNKLNPTNSKVEGYLSDIGGTTQGRFTQYAGADSVSYIYPCLPNTTYTVSHTGNTNAIAEFDKYPISGDAGNIVYNRTLTTSSTTKWLVIYVNSTWTDDDLHAQLEYGDTATTYEPYKESTKTLYLNSPLLEGDTIEEKDNGIYHVHRWKELVLDDSIDWKSDTKDSTKIMFRITVSDKKNNSNVITDKYPVLISTWKKNYITSYLNHIYLALGADVVADLVEFKVWISNNPIKAVYELAEPTYELIEQSNLTIPSYANGHLDFNTAIPVEKVEFKPFSEELTYLYPSTSYTVQFISTRAILADLILGGTSLLSQSIVAGLNRISITTPSELVDNKLTINGNDTGANIMEVIVTDIDRELEYFEGMKSVGEGKELQVISINSERRLVNTQRLTHEPLRGTRDAKDRYVLIDGKWYIERKCGVRAYQEGDKDNYKTDLINTVYPLEMPTYEEINYNPLEVYSGTTHITTNSTIPTNITVKNHGFNCLLKPSTTYTISSNLGLNTVTTPSKLTEDCLRFMDTDTSDVTTMRDVLILEGDWTSKADLIPSNFSGIESAFEQEYDAEKGKYKVNVKVANEDKSKENNITFYINEPLRGIGDVKDRVYIKDDKVVVERNCGIRAYEDGDFGTYITDKINTVYQLAEPTYEEVEYNDTKLFIESFKNSTLFYNSNVPVTSKLYYSYSVPLVDAVAKTADISDQQDSMIIDLATQCAVMEMYLM